MSDHPQLPEYLEPTAVPEGKAAAIGLMEDYVKFKIAEQVLAPLAQSEPSLTLHQVLQSLRTEADRALNEIIQNARIAETETP